MDWRLKLEWLEYYLSRPRVFLRKTCLRFVAWCAYGPGMKVLRATPDELDCIGHDDLTPAERHDTFRWLPMDNEKPGWYKRVRH